MTTKTSWFIDLLSIAVDLANAAVEVLKSKTNKSALDPINFSWNVRFLSVGEALPPRKRKRLTIKVKSTIFKLRWPVLR